MKSFVLMVAVCAATLAGCSTCRQWCGGLFNRGDKCNVCPPPDCPPGMPRSTLMVPGSMPVLPGPMEIAPLN
jgi:hypothetical protein